jgi:hypothetical protein
MIGIVLGQGFQIRKPQKDLDNLTKNNSKKLLDRMNPEVEL